MNLPTDKMLAVKEDGIGWMIYNNPERHNAMSLEMQAAVPAIFGDFQKDDAVRVAVMRGAGEKAFISGADITEFDKERASPDSIASYRETMDRSRAGFIAFEKPLIAMIHGYCIGGGLAVALNADIRICAEDAQFGIPAARLGLGYEFGGINTLVKLVGPAYASEILFTARRFSADEALRMGLVNRVVAKQELEKTVRELASSIAANAPLTVKAARFAIHQTQRDPDRRDMARCDLLVKDCFQSQDYVEGRLAFKEKRQPQFKGR